MENWKPIEGWENYEISDFGNVRSVRTYPDNKRTSRHRNGYAVVGLYGNGKRCFKYVHRLVIAAFLYPSDDEVNHRDLNKQNNHISNLEYSDRESNMRHRYMGEVRGVTYSKKRKSYQARMQINKKCTHLGWFRTYGEASECYRENFKNTYGTYPYNTDGDLL